MSSENKPVPKAPVWPHGYSEGFKRAEEWKQHRDGPKHYTCATIQPIDFINAWEMSLAEGRVIQLVTRAPYTGNRLNDLRKARWYLEELIKEAQK